MTLYHSTNLTTVAIQVSCWAGQNLLSNDDFHHRLCSGQRKPGLGGPEAFPRGGADVLRRHDVVVHHGVYQVRQSFHMVLKKLLIKEQMLQFSTVKALFYLCK